MLLSKLWSLDIRQAPDPISPSIYRGALEFGHLGGSHLECAGLTALCWPAALTQAPTADASKNSQQAFQVHFEDKSLRNVCFKNVANFLVLVWGRCQASANESGVKPPHPNKPRPLVVA
jgi:hypothetical protein